METLLQPPLLLDGAAATAYRKAGMPAGAVPAFWALEHPDMAGDLVRPVHGGRLRRPVCPYLRPVAFVPA